MPAQPECVLLVRSGRHLGVALDALAAASPGCRVTVLATPGIERAAVQADDRVQRLLIYDSRPRFQPMALLRSGLVLSLWRQRFDRVAVLWPDRAGTGQSNVDRSALLVAPRGFDAITPDGTIVPRHTTSQVTRELLRAACSCGVLAVLGLLLYLPAALAAAVRPASWSSH